LRTETGLRKNRFIGRLDHPQSLAPDTSHTSARDAREATAAPTVGALTSANDAIVNTSAIGLPARWAQRSPSPALLRLLVGFELVLDDGDDDPQRLGDVQGGVQCPRRTDDRRDGDEDVLDLLDRDARIHCCADVHQI
jgi:hypothetical protein